MCQRSNNRLKNILVRCQLDFVRQNTHDGILSLSRYFSWQAQKISTKRHPLTLSMKRNQVDNVLGLTLIEMMMAMTISLLLVSLILAMYLAAERSYELQLALSHIQHNARRAITILRNEFHKAGEAGYPNNTISGDENSITIHALEFPGSSKKGMENSRNTFFIAKTKRFDRSGLPVYALYLKDTNHHKMELVAGISRIRFSYTLFENGKIWIRKIITEKT